MSKVADFLRRSMALHVQAKASKGTPRRPHDARHKWAQAYYLRHQAHGFDPHHTDPAWEEEQTRTPNGRDTHLEITTFYKSMGLSMIEPEAEPVSQEPIPPETPSPAPDSPRLVEEPQPASAENPEPFNPPKVERTRKPRARAKRAK